MLGHPENQFLVTYDGPETDVARLRDAIQASDIIAKRIIVRQSIPVHWCGPSQAMMLIDVLEQAAQLGGWKQFINLSGQCAPLVSQATLFDRLKHEQIQYGKEAHVFSFQVKKQIKIPELTDHAIVEEKIGRLKLIGASSLLQHFKDPEFFPVIRVANRLILKCTEPDPVQKKLAVSLPYPDELTWRLEYLRRKPHYAGRAWFIFSRKYVEALCVFFESPSSDDWRRIFLNCFEPDESFIQSAIANYSLIPDEHLSRSNLRAFEGSPRTLTFDDYNRLVSQQKSLFARKFQHGKDGRLAAAVEAVARGQ